MHSLRVMASFTVGVARVEDGCEGGPCPRRNALASEGCRPASSERIDISNKNSLNSRSPDRTGVCDDTVGPVSDPQKGDSVSCREGTCVGYLYGRAVTAHVGKSTERVVWSISIALHKRECAVVEESM